MEVGDMLPVQRFGDGQLAGDGVDDEDPGGRLVGAGTRHAVTQLQAFIPVRADLQHAWRREKKGRRSKPVFCRHANTPWR